MQASKKDFVRFKDSIFALSEIESIEFEESPTALSKDIPRIYQVGIKLKNSHYFDFQGCSKSEFEDLAKTLQVSFREGVSDYEDFPKAGQRRKVKQKYEHKKI